MLCTRGIGLFNMLSRQLLQSGQLMHPGSSCGTTKIGDVTGVDDDDFPNLDSGLGLESRSYHPIQCCHGKQALNDATRKQNAIGSRKRGSCPDLQTLSWSWHLLLQKAETSETQAIGVVTLDFAGQYEQTSTLQLPQRHQITD